MKGYLLSNTDTFIINQQEEYEEEKRRCLPEDWYPLPLAGARTHEKITISFSLP